LLEERPSTGSGLEDGENKMDEGKEKSLAFRCLALTGSFETGQLAPGCFAAVAGNFDGQGMSFGALQWNFGQGTLQPLLQEMFDYDHDIALQIFGEDLNPLHKAIKDGTEASVSFAIGTILAPGSKSVSRTWKEKFRLLGLTHEFQVIETKAVAAYYAKAVKLCEEYELWTERGRALMFDIAVQNGGISEKIKNIILEDVGKLAPDFPPEAFETAKMRIIAKRRAEAANPKYIEDVRTRKLCIAEGQGIVHGINYDLAGQFGLSLQKMQ